MSDVLNTIILETQPKTYDIFISYRTTHSDWVETLAHNLKDQEYSLFFDKWELPPGQSFIANIHDALKHSRCAILVATLDASNSGWVQDEYETMLRMKNSGSGFFFIPVVMGQFPDLPFLKNAQAVDFQDSQKDLYRCAFQKLLCGVTQQPPGPDPCFQGDLKFPEVVSDSDRPLAESERSFVESVFDELETGMPLMVLAQADTNTRVYCQALRDRVESRFGAANVLHIFPPNSAQADSAAYFGRLARQCGFDGDISESWEWADELADKLENSREVFLLITGFENGADESRDVLAGEIRSLHERYPAFRVIMMGGRRLAALKYAQGDMSLLNLALDMPIPELDSGCLSGVFAHLYPKLALSPEQLCDVLEFTGSHPRLLHHCLQQNLVSCRACEESLRASPLPAQLFNHFREGQDRALLCDLLKNQGSLGRFDLWPLDELLRRLYWSNLIARRGEHLAWRCEFIRQTGLEMLTCG